MADTQPQTRECWNCGDEIPAAVEICETCGAPQNQGSKQPAEAGGAALRLDIGDEFAGRYEVRGVAEESELGPVYKVQDREIGVSLALTLIRPELVPDEDARKRFRKAVKNARRFLHDHVVKIYESGEHEGTLYYTMEFVSGVSLRKLIQVRADAHQFLGVEETLPILEQLAGVLDAGHKNKLVHGALDPENVTILPQGLKVSEFGLVTFIDPGKLRELAAAQGHEAYLAPELSAGKDYEKAVDVYSLGAIIYEMLTGTTPMAEPAPPSDRNEAVPLAVDELVLKCLSADPAKRPQAAGEIIERLRAAVAGKTEAAGEAVAPAPTESGVSAGSVPVEEASAAQISPPAAAEPEAPSAEAPEAEPAEEAPKPAAARAEPEPVQKAPESAAPPKPAPAKPEPAQEAPKPAAIKPEPEPRAHQEAPSKSAPAPEPSRPTERRAPVKLPQPAPAEAKTSRLPAVVISMLILVVVGGAGAAYFLGLLPGSDKGTASETVVEYANRPKGESGGGGDDGAAAKQVAAATPEKKKEERQSRTPTPAEQEARARKEADRREREAAQRQAEEEAHRKAVEEAARQREIAARREAEAAARREREAKAAAAAASRCPDGMVEVGGGRFPMGSAANDPSRDAWEKQLEPTKIRPFCMDRYEFPNEKGRPPRVNVSWEQARALCSARGKRLCTEEEWERACKGKNNSRYPYGDQFHPNACNTQDAAKKDRSLLPSGSFDECKSDFGVYDLSGSVAEWTASSWSSGSPDRVVRGGSYTQPDWGTRCARRENYSADESSEEIGFRCCAD